MDAEKFAKKIIREARYQLKRYLEEDLVLIDVTSSFAGLVRSNSTAAFIVECLKTDTTKEQIVEAMYEKYNAPKDVLQKDVESIVEKLRGIGAIEE